MDHKPIPALYCCYLLRFGQSIQTLYVGSTPNPRRRLAQHLGVTKGGARRTTRKGSQWDMICIVTGFPSTIAALQFEWAWNNPHKTKRVADEDRIVRPRKVKKKDRDGEGLRNSPSKPKVSLNMYLSHLHLLLRGPSFQTWPLHLRFFSDDIFQRWKRTCEAATKQLAPEITAILDLKQTSPSETQSDQLPLSTYAKSKQRREAIGKGGVDGLDVSYARYKGHLEKSLATLKGTRENSCVLCSRRIPYDNQTTLVCPHDTCSAVSHLSCLATVFRKIDEPAHVVPMTGKCPSCRNEVQWIDLMTELSLRARGQREVSRILKKPRGAVDERHGFGGRDSAAENGEDDDLDETSDEPLPEHWQPQDNDSDDTESVTSAASEPSHLQSHLGTLHQPKGRLKAVIEDSEGVEDEALD